MSAVFADPIEGLIRTTNIVQPNTDYTISGWFYVGNIPAAGTFRTFFWLQDVTGANWVWIGQDPVTGNIAISVNGVGFFGSDDLPAPGWYYITYRRIVGTTRHEVLLNGAIEAWRTIDLSAVTLTQVSVGTDGFAVDWDPGKAAYVREHAAALDILTEIYNEMISPTAVMTADLVTDTPLLDDLLDDSGNGNDWSESGGTITFSAPTNTTQGTAIALGSLPAAVVGSLEVYEAWYYYDAVDPDQVIGALADTDEDQPGTARRVWVTTYETYPTVYIGAESAGDSRIQFPVTVGTRYYFRVRATTLGLVDVFDLSVYRAPNLGATIPNNAVVINSDTAGFPAVILDRDTAEIYGFKADVVRGETADIIHGTNRSLLSNLSGPPYLAIYDRDMNLVRSMTAFSGNVGSGNQVDRYYGVFREEDDHIFIHAVEANGDLGQRWGPVDAIDDAVLMAVNREETIAYISNGALQGSDNYVARWDLVNDVRLSDFLGPLVYKGFAHRLHSQGSPGSILTLDNGNVVIAWYSQNGVLSHFRMYEPDGTLVNLFDWNDEMGSALLPAIDRLAHDPDDKLNMIWIWGKRQGHGAFFKFNVTSWTMLAYAGGGYGAEVFDGARMVARAAGNTAPTSEDLFGHPFSCPFFLLRDVEGAGGGSGDGGDGGGGADDGSIVGPLVWFEWPRRVPTAP